MKTLTLFNELEMKLHKNNIINNEIRYNSENKNYKLPIMCLLFRQSYNLLYYLIYIFVAL